MEERDIEDACRMLNHYLEKFVFAPVYTSKVQPPLPLCPMWLVLAAPSLLSPGGVPSLVLAEAWGGRLLCG